MADNVEITAGSGTKVATDEVGGVQVQRIKVQYGEDGAATDVSNAAPMPVNVTTATGAGAGIGTTADAESESGNGTVIALLKRLRKLLGEVIVTKITEAVTVKKVEEAVTVKKIEEALPTGTNSIGKLANAEATIGRVELNPRTGGGLEKNRKISEASTNATSVKASAGQVYGWYLYNAGAATRYFKIYNKASAPTVGTDVPVLTIPLPPGAAANVEYTMGITLGTGIAFALTKGLADANTEAVGAEEVVVNLLYK